MKLLEERILKDGVVLPGNVLKVGHFLNQQIDSSLMKSIGEEISRLFKDSGVTKILTIESSGIAIAMAAGLALDIPVVFAKKHATSNVDGETYVSSAFSYTHQKTYSIVVSKAYLTKEDKILLVDDFLAVGNALNALVDLSEQAEAEICGAAICIEKAFQGGGDALREKGYRVESLACIESMEGGNIVFRR